MSRKLRFYFYKFQSRLEWYKFRLQSLMKAKGTKVNHGKLMYWSALSMFGLILFGFIGSFFVFAWFSRDLPTPNKAVRREGYSSRIYDRNGEVLYDLFRDAKMTPAKWDDVPDSLRKAVVAVEDKDFYKHQGFDPIAPFRIVKNYFVLGKLTGGSTITQQLVKNVVLEDTSRSPIRKIKEFILATQLEKRYKKDEILLMYLNENPYGGAIRGVEMAAETYFDKPLKELNLAESAILAGIPQRPNAFSPFNGKAYVDRTAHVLARMREDGVISKETEVKTLEEVENYKFAENKTQILAPHFVFWVKEELTKKYGEEAVEGGGLKITTTLDLKLQQEAQKIVSEEVDKAEKMGISNGAAIVLDPINGQVLAMVGSRGYFSDKTDGEFNVVTNGLRQPGSSIKPITYLAGLKKGMTAATMIMDTPVTFPGGQGQKDYAPQNYNGKFNGPMSLRAALGNSINTTAVKMLAEVGVQNMLSQAYDMGITTLQPTTENLKRFGLAVTLGGAEVKMHELAGAYSAFANGGKKVEVTGVLKVEDRNGRVLEEFKPITGKRVMTPQEAFIISNILSDNSAREMTFGATNGLQIPNYQVAVKTGTTNDKRDNWAIGWTPNLLVTAWVGNNDNSPMLKVASGVSGATPIWRRIMLMTLPSRPKQDFPIPDRIVNMEVDKISGYAAHDGFPARPEYFVDGTQPKFSDPIHMKLKVCRGQNGLAPPGEVAVGNYDEKEYFKFKETDPVSKDGKNRWQEGIDKWIAGLPDKDKYNPPENYCDGGRLLDVTFDSPAHQSTVGNSTEVKIKVTSGMKINEVKLWVDGVEKMTWNEKPYETSLDLGDGPHTLKVRATDKDGNSAERETKVGVNVPWDWSPTPTSVPTAVPSPTLVPTVVVPTTGV